MKKTLLLLCFVFSLSINAQTYYSQNFDTGGLNSWTTTDLNNDGLNWAVLNASSVDAAFGVGSLMSFSYNDATETAVTPNNLVTSPVINLTAVTASNVNLFYDFKTHPSWPAEHYAVYVTTTNVASSIITTTPVFETTVANGNLGTKQINLSSYIGQNVYISYRHFNCYDKYYLVIDNINIKTILPNEAELASLTNIQNAYALNSAVTVAGVVKNNGSNAITSLDVNWSVDGAPQNTFALTGINIASGATYNFTHSTTWTATPAGSRALTVNLSNINGGTDPNLTDNSITKNILVVNEVFPKTVVYEEGTGTWCGYCPRGHVGLKDMYHNHADGSFIGIAVQNGSSNPMTLAAYNSPISAQISGYPSGLLNRGAEEVDPGLNDIEAAYQAEINKIPVAKIEVTSNSWNSATRVISLGLSAKFALDLSSANYNIAAIVVENDVTGTTSGYNQVNYYSGGSIGNLTDWQGTNWATLANPVPAASMIYNHVGRALLGGFAGLSGVVPASVTYNTPYTTTFTHTLPTTQDESQIKLVAIIIDNATGGIINATEVALNTTLANTSFTNDLGFKIYPNPSNGIVNISTSVTSDIIISDISGKTVFSKNQLFGENEINLSNLQSGIYFVKAKSETTETVSKLILK